MSAVPGEREAEVRDALADFYAEAFRHGLEVAAEYILREDQPIVRDRNQITAEARRQFGEAYEDDGWKSLRRVLAALSTVPEKAEP